MYTAKSLTGHLYSYTPLPLPKEAEEKESQEGKEDLKESQEPTVADFLADISQRYKIPVAALHLLDPDTEESLRADEPLRADHVYALFMDTPLPEPLSWIDRKSLTQNELLKNPAYPLTAEEVAALTTFQRPTIASNPNPDTLALINPYLLYAEDLFEERSHFDPRRRDFPGLDQDGWKILAMNEAAIPLLEAHYETVLLLFPHLACRLATNEAAIPLLTRLLADPRTRYPQHVAAHRFQTYLCRNPAAIPLLGQYPDLMGPHFEGEMDGSSVLYTNPGAIPHLQHRLTQHPELENTLPWRTLCTLPEAIPLLRQYPHRIENTIAMNPDPAALEWIRHIPFEDLKPIHWKTLCQNTDPAFLEFIQHHLENHPPSDLPDNAWIALSANPTAISWLHACHPEQMWWTFVCQNPSPDVIPMIETYLDLHQHDPDHGIAPEWSFNLAHEFHFRHILYQKDGISLKSPMFKSLLQPVFLSVHPHSLPLLQKHPELIYWRSFSTRTDIFEVPQWTLL